MPAAALVSIIGSVLFLGAFGALNTGLLDSQSYPYQIANFLGAACFTYTALAPFNAGLFITEAAWALIGIYGIITVMRTAKAKSAKKNAATLEGHTPA
ncbi:MAG: hypothetical protein Q4P36_00970 [Bowdeniella nasicola]|nr:hypothetical protein [Bowdeniella nasicola]